MPDVPGVTNGEIIDESWGDLVASEINTLRALATSLGYVPPTSFVPGLTFSDAAVGMTFGTRECWYQQIGKLVTVSGVIQLSAKGSSTGIAKLTGLPVAVINSFSRRGGGQVVMVNTMAGVVPPVTVLPIPNTTTAELRMGNAVTYVNATNANFTDTTTIYFVFAYFAA